ncbi:MAG TPA: hypothetical protein VH349_11750 [Ktedonobacterales bacterium]|jgi:hypothetical protein
MSAPTTTQSAPRITSFPRRAFSVLTFTLLSLLLPLILLYMMLNVVLVKAYGIRFNEDGSAVNADPATLIPATVQVVILLLLIAPATLGGSYWFALLRRRAVGAPRVLAELLPLDASFALISYPLVGIAIYFYIGSNVADTKTRALVAPTPLWTLERLVKTPGIPLLLVAMALLFSLLAWVCSAPFARWANARRARQEQGAAAHPLWRDFLLVFGVTSLVMFAMLPIGGNAIRLFSEGSAQQSFDTIRSGFVALALMLILPPVLLVTIAAQQTRLALRRDALRASEIPQAQG